MLKGIKKILSIIICTVMVFTALPISNFINVSAATSGYYTYTVSNGEVTITDCDTSISGDVTIPSTLGGYPVTSLGESAFESCKSLTSIIIPESVTYMDWSVFRSCINLISVKISKGIKGIGPWTFSYCKNLENVLIPDGVTEIGYCSFEYCESLTSITIPNSVEIISDEAFAWCTGLTNINIPDNVRYIGNNAFAACKSITSIETPASVTEIGYHAFDGCDNLASINVSSDNDIYSSFGGVLFNKEKTILIFYPDGKTETSYSIPNSVTTIDFYAFSHCISLKNLIIPNNVTNIIPSAFYGCSSLESIYYCGTEEDWNKITIGTDNEFLTNATRYYHNFGEWIIVKNSTCTESGEKYRICSVCDEKETQTIPVTDHSYESVINLPTCTLGGNTTHTCTICGDSYIDNKVSALGHSFGEWVISKNATCTESGEKYRICSVCGEKETEIISALGHDYSDEFTIDKEATDFEEGSKSRHCSRCDSVTDVTVIPKTSIANGTCGESAVWAITQNGTLIIQGSGATNDYKLPNLAPWYSYADSITSVKIGEGITRLGNNNFSGLKNLSVAEFGNPDTEFGTYVFATNADISVKVLSGGNVEEFAKTNGYKIIKDENPNTPIIVEIIEISGNSVTLKAVEGYEYSIDGINWQTDNTFSELKEGTSYTFYQRIAEDIYAASVMSEGIAVTTLSAPEKPVIESIVKNIATLKATVGYEYSIDGINWQSGNVFTIPMNEIICFYQRAMANGIYTASPISSAAKGISVSAPKVMVSDNGIYVKATEGFEYGLENILWQESPEFTEYIISGDTYSVQQRYIGADDVFAVYDEIGTAVTVNGTKKPTVINAEYFTWLRKCMFTVEESNDYAADINGDFTVDIRDLISLKNILLEAEESNIGKTAYIEVTNVNVRDNPNFTNSSIIGKLSDISVEILDSVENSYGLWYKITYYNGTEQVCGYILYDSDYIRIESNALA